MFRQRLVRGVWVLLLLTLCPGCHVLVRLGEPAGRESAPVIDADGRPQDGSPPSGGPETPPLPGLDNGEDRPPAPGLENGGEPRAESDEPGVSLSLSDSGLSILDSADQLSSS